MSRRGTYPRTEAVRAKNRANPGWGIPCADGCTCGKHRPQAGRPRRKCPPGCGCGRHQRTPIHNARIGMSVALTAEAKRA